MTFLKKFGGLIVKGLQIVSGLQSSGLFPTQAGALQVVSKDLASIAEIITQVEVMGQVLGSPGADKLRAATPLVAQIVLQSSILARHEIANPELFRAGCQQIAAGMADVLNSLKDDVGAVDKT